MKYLYPHILLSPDGDAPTGTPPPKDPPAGSAGGGNDQPGADDKVSLSRKEYDALIAARAKQTELEGEATALRQYREKARTLLRPGDDREAAVNNMRELMKDAGYSDDQIEAHVASQLEGEGDDRGGDGGEDDAPRGRRGRAREEEQGPSEMDVLKQEVSSIKADQVKERQRTLKDLLYKSTDSVLDRNQILSTLVKYDLDGEDRTPEQREQAAAQLAADVRKETLERLRARSQEYQGKVWKDEWIAEETLKAADIIAKRCQVLVGNPSRLGANRGGRLGEDELSRRQRAPEPDRKAPTHVQEAQATAWINSELSSAAMETGSGRTRA